MELGVKEAVHIAFGFIEDLYGAQTRSYAQLEEVEFNGELGQWLVTISIESPAGYITKGNSERRWKAIYVDPDSRDVISMKNVA